MRCPAPPSPVTKTPDLALGNVQLFVQGISPRDQPISLRSHPKPAWRQHLGHSLLVIIRDQLNTMRHYLVPEYPGEGGGALTSLWKGTRNCDMNCGQAAQSLPLPQVPHLSSHPKSSQEQRSPQSQREPHIPMRSQSCFLRANPGHLCSLQRSSWDTWNIPG